MKYFIPNRRFWLLAMLLMVIVPTLVLAFDTTPTAPQPTDIVPTLIMILTPLVVYVATKIITKFAPNIPAVMVTTLVVPVLSGVLVLVTQVLGANTAWWAQLIVGLGGTFIHELVKNLNPAPPST